MRISVRRPSPALVISCVALTVALGGTSYATVLQVPRNSVGPAQLKTAAVTNRKIAANAVTSAKVANGSLVTMLVNTNDAFTGLDSLRLRGRGETRSTMAYDGGSEKNNELKSHIPGPCCGSAFVRDPEGALIRPHDGITGVGQLTQALYDWDGPAARIAIERVS